MNSNLMPTTVFVDELILNNIVDVQETIANKLDYSGRKNRRFSTTDLWNIRRNARLASTLRRF